MVSQQLLRVAVVALALSAACGIESRVVQERGASAAGAAGLGGKGGLADAGKMPTPGGTFGTPSGGASPFMPSGGMPSGGMPSGGMPSGGMPSGGMVTAGGPPSFPGTGGMGTIPGLDCALQAGHALPLVVTDVYVPSGYYETSSLEMRPGPECGERVPGARGNCFSFTWFPKHLEWVGAQFQYPVNNWTGPGMCIEAGATAITFWVKGELHGGFSAFDAVGTNIEKITPTGVWTRYRIDLTGIDYNRYIVEGGVRGAFSFVLTRDSSDYTQKDLFIDGVEWVREATVPGAGGAGGASDGGGDAGGSPGTAGAGGEP